MITIVECGTTYEFRGLSSDEKPVKFANGEDMFNGSIFFCMDTSEVYAFDGENKEWVLL